MSVSAVSPAASSYQTSFDTNIRKSMKDFKALAHALESGDMNAAKEAFASFKKDMQKSE